MVSVPQNKAGCGQEQQCRRAQRLQLDDVYSRAGDYGKRRREKTDGETFGRVWSLYVHLHPGAGGENPAHLHPALGFFLGFVMTYKRVELLYTLNRMLWTCSQ
jgi:hypothetical protein